MVLNTTLKGMNYLCFISVTPKDCEFNFPKLEQNKIKTHLGLQTNLELDCRQE